MKFVRGTWVSFLSAFIKRRTFTIGFSPWHLETTATAALATQRTIVKFILSKNEFQCILFFISSFHMKKTKGNLTEFYSHVRCELHYSLAIESPLSDSIREINWRHTSRMALFWYCQENCPAFNKRYCSLDKFFFIVWVTSGPFSLINIEIDEIPRDTKLHIRNVSVFL